MIDSYRTRPAPGQIQEIMRERVRLHQRRVMCNYNRKHNETSLTLWCKRLPDGARRDWDVILGFFWKVMCSRNIKEMSIAFILHSRNREFVMFD